MSLRGHKDTTCNPAMAPTRSSKWAQTIDSSYADWICLLLCFNTGLCDSCAFNSWSCFLAMQTGNTIVLGLGASQQPIGSPHAWSRSLVSIFSFIIGGIFFARLTHFLGPRRRGTLVISFAIQSIMIIVTAALIQTGVIQKQIGNAFTFENPNLALIPIALMAFQSAGSINSTRVLGFNEIPGVVLTSVYYDLASDALFFQDLAANPKRNRRVAGALMLLTGAIVGGWLSRSAGGMAVSLWLAAFLKFTAGVGWFFWSPA
ncbi:DUF1275 domain protein [Penicillium verhagenii]|uniref:DUF1275 domain protein n=1 Tax=Penicillium verhagenii TaxID=1562060 RepID=UPI00254578C0|nr:DUF1275 domain protein [Penicillium verhagenii]KAJ5936760.1 DUF1275 domain protein [Penicillium verhagenii]